MIMRFCTILWTTGEVPGPVESDHGPFYDMGKDRLAYAGMDDAGEMSSWDVFNAMGIYPFSPADEDYIVSAPLFDRVEIQLGDGDCEIVKGTQGAKPRTSPTTTEELMVILYPIMN